MIKEKGVYVSRNNTDRAECVAQLVMRDKKFFRAYSVSKYGLDEAYFLACCSRWQFEYEVKRIGLDDIVRNLIRHEKRLFYTEKPIITTDQAYLIDWYLKNKDYYCLFMNAQSAYVLDSNYRYAAQHRGVPLMIDGIKKEIIEKIQQI